MDKSQTMQRKILLLEDDKTFCQTLEDFLSIQGYWVDATYSAKEAYEMHYSNRYDLYLLDINIPDINGLQFLKGLRNSGDKVPAIFLTSYRNLKTLRAAFDCGCDDYIKKPCDLEELAYRVKAVLKRGVKQKAYFNSNCFYCFNNQKLYLNDKETKLQEKTLSLLELFLENSNQVVTKEMIIDKLWSPSEDASDNSIRTYIKQLRGYIGGEKIVNFKGIGYRLKNI